MTVNSNGDYEALAKLLYPSIEASGNVYYGQTRKLTLDEVFDKNNGGFKSHIESRRVEDTSSEYGFKYEKYFCWKVGSLHGEININNIRLDSYPLYYAKYLITKDVVSETNVLNSGEYSSYHFDVSTTIKEIFYHSDRNPTDETAWDGKKFYIVNDNGIYYMYIPIINGAENDLLPEEYDQNNPLCISKVGDCGYLIKLVSTGSIVNKSIYEYSFNKTQWSNFDIDDVNGVILEYSNSNMYIRVKQGANKDSYNTSNFTSFYIEYIRGDGYLELSGDIRSMQQDPDELQPYEFCNLFNGCSRIYNVCDLPCMTLSTGCYYRMFMDCTNIKYPPTLFAINLEEQCYSGMFAGCTSLTKTPVLKSINLAEKCYSGMFTGCTNLEKVSALPAQTVPTDAYNSMFAGCSSLKSKVYIFANDISNRGCNMMLSNCTNLSDVYCAVGNESSGSDAFVYWMLNNNTTIHTSLNSSWSTDNTSIIPLGCTLVRDFELKWEF